jgi:hypothetical protein
LPWYLLPSAPSRDEEKISTAEHAETAEYFLQTKNIPHSGDISSSLRPPGPLRFVVHFLFFGKNLCFFGSSGDEEKRMTTEKAESAEIFF